MAKAYRALPFVAADEGPLRVVAPGDKYPARWVRSVVRVTVVPVSVPAG